MRICICIHPPLSPGDTHIFPLHTRGNVEGPTTGRQDAVRMGGSAGGTPVVYKVGHTKISLYNVQAQHEFQIFLYIRTPKQPITSADPQGTCHDVLNSGQEDSPHMRIRAGGAESYDVCGRSAGLAPEGASGTARLRELRAASRVGGTLLRTAPCYWACRAGGGFALSALAVVIFAFPVAEGYHGHYLGLHLGIRSVPSVWLVSCALYAT